MVFDFPIFTNTSFYDIILKSKFFVFYFSKIFIIYYLFNDF